MPVADLWWPTPTLAVPMVVATEYVPIGRARVRDNGRQSSAFGRSRIMGWDKGDMMDD